MVGFELERHLPFPPSDAVFDFEVLDSGADRPVRVLLVAVERRSQERIHQLLRDAGLTPRLIGVGIHSLGRLAAASAGSGRILLWLEATDAELAVVVRGRVVASRAFPLPANGEARGPALEAEITRTLAALPEADRADVAEVLVGGQTPPAFAADTLPVRIGVDAPPGIPVPEDTSLMALAAALERPGRRPLVANLLPDDLRPRPFPWPLAATAAIALVTLGIGLAIPGVAFVRERRALAALEAAIARARARGSPGRAARRRGGAGPARGDDAPELPGAGSPSPAGPAGAHGHAAHRRVADDPVRGSHAGSSSAGSPTPPPSSSRCSRLHPASSGSSSRRR